MIAQGKEKDYNSNQPLKVENIVDKSETILTPAQIVNIGRVVASCLPRHPAGRHNSQGQNTQ